MSIDLRQPDSIASRPIVTNAEVLPSDGGCFDGTLRKCVSLKNADDASAKSHGSLEVLGTTVSSSTLGWASPSVVFADLEDETLPHSLFHQSVSSTFSPPHRLVRHSSSNATEVIQRFESLQSQSASYKEYKDWKETKWGEDNLDEVEFEDDDINLELSLPNVFARPLPFPSASDFWTAVESTQARLVACALSLTDMVLSAEYYIARPGELLTACKAAVAVWVPKPPAWIAAPLMSVVMSGDIHEILNEGDEDDYGSEDSDGPSDAGSVAMSVASQLAHRVQEHTSRMTQVICGVALGLVAAVSFSLVYVYALFRIGWRYVARGEGSRVRTPNSWATAHHKGNGMTMWDVAPSPAPDPENPGTLRHRTGAITLPALAAETLPGEH